MDFSLSAKHREIYETVGELGRTRFAPRAAALDRAARSPVENLRELYEAGYAAAALSEEIGGLGGGALGTDPLASLLVVEQTARYCLSTAQCIHIHYNSSHRIDQICTDEQRERYLRPVVEKGAWLNSTGSEPGRTARGLYALATEAEKVQGGWVLNGVKNYATSPTRCTTTPFRPSSKARSRRRGTSPSPSPRVRRGSPSSRIPGIPSACAGPSARCWC